MKKINFILWIKSPIGILLIAGFVLRVIMFFLFQPYNHLNEVLVSDADGYHRLALELLNKGNFIVPNTTLDAFRTPAYPAFINLIYLVFGVNPPLVLFIQIFVNLASVYVLYLIGENIFNRKIGFISALLLSLDLDHLYNIYSLLTDTLFVLFLLLACLYLIYFFNRKKLFYLIMTSSFIGIATLVRPITLFFPLVIIFIVIIYTFHNKKRNLLKTIMHISLILIAYGLVISPWIIRNYSLYGYPKLSSLSGQLMLNYNVAFTIKRNDNRSIDEICEELNTLVMKKDTPEKLSNPFYKSKVQSDIAVDFILKHKVDYLKSNLLGSVNVYTSMGFKPFAYRFFRVSDYTAKDNIGAFDKFSINVKRFKTLPYPIIITGSVYALFFLFYYSASLWGTFILLSDKRLKLLLSVFAVISYFTVLVGVVGLARYKMPISPFYILIGAYCISSFIDKKNTQNSTERSDSLSE